MPGVVRRHSGVKTDGELKMRVIAVLDEATESDIPTLDWIKEHDFVLAPYSTQKLSRILGQLSAMGIVQKGKSKSLGRMVYRLTSKMQQEGYDVEGMPYVRQWRGVSWEAEDEKRGFDNDDTEY